MVRLFGIFGRDSSEQKGSKGDIPQKKHFVRSLQSDRLPISILSNASKDASNLKYNVVNDTVTDWTGKDFLSYRMQGIPIRSNALLGNEFSDYSGDLCNISTFFKTRDQIASSDFKEYVNATRYPEEYIVPAVISYALVYNKTSFMGKLINGDRPSIDQMNDSLEEKMDFIKTISPDFDIKPSDRYIGAFSNNHKAIEQIKHMFKLSEAYNNLKETGFFNDSNMKRLAGMLNSTPSELERMGSYNSRFDQFRYDLDK